MKRNICAYLLVFNFLLTTFIYAEGKPTLNYQMNYKVTNWSSGASCMLVKFQPENFPKYVSLIFEAKTLDQKIQESRQVFVDNQNQLIDAESKREYNLSLGPFAKGEPVECILRTNLLYASDKQVHGSVSIVPRPLQAKDEVGHILSLRLVSADGRMFWMTAEGFEPLEVVEFCSISGSEVLRHKVQMTEEGRLDTLLAPAVIGKEWEKASVEIKGKNTKDLKVNYKWGLKVFY